MENNLKLLRAERKLTQAQLARKSGLSRTALLAIENGTSIPDGESIAKLVRALGVPANRIFFALDVVCEQQKEV
jgi:putative transcriptional regulator